MTKTSTDDRWLLAIRWKKIGGTGFFANRGCGSRSWHYSPNSAYRKLRNAIHIIAGSKAEHVTDWTVKHRKDGGVEASFHTNSGDGHRIWEYTLEPVTKGRQ